MRASQMLALRRKGEAKPRLPEPAPIPHLPVVEAHAREIAAEAAFEQPRLSQ